MRGAQRRDRSPFPAPPPWRSAAADPGDCGADALCAAPILQRLPVGGAPPAGGGHHGCAVLWSRWAAAVPSATRAASRAERAAAVLLLCCGGGTGWEVPFPFVASITCVLRCQVGRRTACKCYRAAAGGWPLRWRSPALQCRMLPLRLAVNQLNYCSKGSGGDLFSPASIMYTLGARRRSRLRSSGEGVPCLCRPCLCVQRLDGKRARAVANCVLGVIA